MVCPGYGQATAVVGCTSPTCTFACKGESYDCNGSPADGCEVADTFPGAHSQATATTWAPSPANDGASAQNISGLADRRARAPGPVVAGFDPASGGAPDWYRICGGRPVRQDDINLTLQVAGSATPDVLPDAGDHQRLDVPCQTSASGSCGVSPGMSSYGDDSEIYLVVEKTCAGGGGGAVSYTITGHL